MNKVLFVNVSVIKYVLITLKVVCQIPISHIIDFIHLNVSTVSVFIIILFTGVWHYNYQRLFRN